MTEMFDALGATIPVILLLVLVPGVFCMRRQTETKEIEKLGNPVCRIRYDHQDRMFYRNLAILLTLFAVLIGVAAQLENRGVISVSIKFTVWHEVVLSYLGVSILEAWYVYINCSSYCRRLRKEGYEVPRRKREYGYCLTKLKKIDVVSGRTTGVSRTSVSLGVVCGVVACGILMEAFSFVVKFFSIKQVLIGGLLVYLVMVLSWLCMMRKYWDERDCSKYRDDVELDGGRKQRVPLIRGLLGICLLLFVHGSILFVMDEAASYVTETIRESEENQVELWRIENEGTEI